MTRYIGVDLHTNSFTVCYLESGKEEKFKTYKLTKAALHCFKQSLRAEDELAVEATGNTDFFVNVIELCVSKVIIVNPRQFTVIRKSVSKTDKNDARTLAFYLSKDMLPKSRRKSKKLFE